MEDQTPYKMFTSSCGVLKVGERKIRIRVLKMNGSTLLFIGNAETDCLDELAVAMPLAPSNGAATAGDVKATKQEVLGTTILGSYDLNTDSKILAEKLSKRFKRQFIVSCNVGFDRLHCDNLEITLNEYIRNHEQEFA